MTISPTDPDAALRDHLPQGCPVAHTYNAFEQADPFAMWSHLRDDDPVYFDEQTGYWVVSRYDDVKAVFGDWETFSSEIAHEPVRPRGTQAQQIMTDGGFTAYSGLSARVPPDHDRIRAAVAKGFTPRRYAALEPTIREIARQRLQTLAAAEERRGDLVKELCEEIPVVTILALLGIDSDHSVETFKRWSGARAAMTWADLSDEEQIPHAHALVEYWQACLDLVSDAHENDRQTLVGDLVRAQRDGDEITDHEIASVCYSLLFAGHETTTVLLSNLFLVLLSNQTAWAQVVSDPGVIPNAVEEVLRVSPSLTAWRRVATRDAEIDGVPVPRGARLLLLMGSANRDERHFEDAQTLDLRRENARSHLTFGYGLHYCLGNRLAKLEAKVVLEEAASLLPTLQLAPGAAPHFQQSLTVRAPGTVEVLW